MKLVPRLLMALTYVGSMALSLASAATSQTVLFQDSFTLNGSTRVEGGSLNGTSPDVSILDNTWHVTAGAPVFSGAGAVTNGTTGPMQAGIAIQPPTEPITVQADIVTNNLSGWVGVGFLNSATATSWWNSSVLWLRISSSGSWFLYENGTKTTLDSGSVSGFNKNAIRTVGITYDHTAGTASVFLNSSNGTTNILTTKTVSSYVNASKLAATGFRVHTDNSITLRSVTIDNFLVTTPATVPAQ